MSDNNNNWRNDNDILSRWQMNDSIISSKWQMDDSNSSWRSDDDVSSRWWIDNSNNSNCDDDRSMSLRCQIFRRKSMRIVNMKVNDSIFSIFQKFDRFSSSFIELITLSIHEIL